MYFYLKNADLIIKIKQFYQKKKVELNIYLKPKNCKYP